MAIKLGWGTSERRTRRFYGRESHLHSRGSMALIDFVSSLNFKRNQRHWHLCFHVLCFCMRVCFKKLTKSPFCVGSMWINNVVFFLCVSHSPRVRFVLAQCELTKSPPLWWLNVNKQICVLCAPVCVSFGFHLIAVLVRGWNPGGGVPSPLRNPVHCWRLWRSHRAFN